MNHKTVVCLLFLLFPVGFFFVPLWVQDHCFAYRDSARFYHRQFEWNQAQWTKGEVPLWNPQENLGAAIVGEASSSVFYPLQLLFLLPIPFGRAFVLYAALHVYLASVGAFFFSRALGCRDEAAVFCGMSYSLCGSVIFQTCNIVFLIGASWLPFCVWMSYLLCRVPRLSCTGWLGIFMGLTILGGEPQTAYHVGILSGLLISTNWWRQRGRLKSSEIKKSVGCHALAVLIAFAIAAIQIFPTWQATQTSTRSDFVKARSIWELGSSRRGSMAGGIFGHPVAGTHHDHLYQFSQAPWTVAELVWPNVSGKIQPRYGRWSEAIPAASRTWTPSIYCGLIAFVFLISAMTRRSPRDDDRWLKLGFAVFALGSLGWFGLGWVAHEAAYCLFRSDPAASWIGAPVGGMYWFFVVCLPGYVKFRYPAKLFIVASLLMCVIASRELQRVIRHEQFSQVRRQFVGVVLVSLVVLVTLWFSSIPINRWFQYLFETVSTEFGPFQPAAAWRAILEGLIHAFVLGMMVIALINQGFRPQLLARLLVLLALCDLTVANRGLIFSAPSEIWQRT
ncbi:MAG: YfhO family protein, partial [Planctomycetota bacterium]|nr:YfhO family protein [Planctomycetota bacterium]